MRDRITFKCSVCGEENYIGTRTFGSFFTLAIHRIPRNQDITHTRSYCPKCNQQTEHKEKK